MIPKYLWQCKDLDQQLAWCEAALLAGRTLSDPGLFLGGADPDKVIRRLRKKHKIKTVRVPRTDAAGVVHKVLGWQIEKSKP